MGAESFHPQGDLDPYPRNTALPSLNPDLHLQEGKATIAPKANPLLHSGNQANHAPLRKGSDMGVFRRAAAVIAIATLSFTAAPAAQAASIVESCVSVNSGTVDVKAKTVTARFTIKKNSSFCKGIKLSWRFPFSSRNHYDYSSIDIGKLAVGSHTRTLTGMKFALPYINIVASTNPRVDSTLVHKAVIVDARFASGGRVYTKADVAADMFVAAAPGIVLEFVPGGKITKVAGWVVLATGLTNEFTERISTDRPCSNYYAGEYIQWGHWLALNSSGTKVEQNYYVRRFKSKASYLAGDRPLCSASGKRNWV